MNNYFKVLMLISMVLVFFTPARGEVVTVTPPMYVLDYAYEYAACTALNTGKKAVTSGKIELIEYSGTVIGTHNLSPQNSLAPGAVILYYEGQPASASVYYCRFTMPNAKVRGTMTVYETKTVHNTNAWAMKHLQVAK
jgi:hypothetical protein